MTADPQLIQMALGLLMSVAFSAVLMGFCLGKEKSKETRGAKAAAPEQKVAEAPVAPEPTPVGADLIRQPSSRRSLPKSAEAETAGQPAAEAPPAPPGSKKSQPKSDPKPTEGQTDPEAPKAPEVPNAPGSAKDQV